MKYHTDKGYPLLPQSLNPDAFLQVGGNIWHLVDVLAFPISNHIKDRAFEKALRKKLNTHYDLVFSVNYYAVIGITCNSFGIPYASLTPLPTTWFGRQPKGCAQTILDTPERMSSTISPVRNQPSPVWLPQETIGEASGDVFMRVLYKTRPYEAVPGSANALHQKWLSIVQKSVQNGKKAEFKKNIIGEAYSARVRIGTGGSKRLLAVSASFAALRNFSRQFIRKLLMPALDFFLPRYSA